MNGYTGRLFEEEVFGVVELEWDGSYVPFRKAMQWVRRNQVGDPTDPEPRVANDLHALVCESLGENDYSRIKFYSAIGSPLDRYHGVDGWFEYMGKIATVDVTLDTQKEQYKASIIAHYRDFATLEGLRVLAQKIGAYLTPMQVKLRTTLG